MEPTKVSGLVKGAVIVGFLVTLFLLCIASYALLTNEGDLLSFLLVPCLIPMVFFFLILVLHTKKTFQYSEKSRDKKVDQWLKQVFGADLTLDDTRLLRREAAKQWHPDQKEEDYREFANDILSRINTLINRMEKEIKTMGYVNWENW